MKPINFVQFLVISLFVMPSAFALQWVSGNGRSCLLACRNASQQAVKSGSYANGKPFFVCRANAHGGGLRPGYNLEPDWSNTCVVSLGGKEIGINVYDCLCTSSSAVGSSNTDSGIIKIISAIYGANCGKRHSVQRVGKDCNGRTTCSGKIDNQYAGADPAPGCGKDFTILYSCGGGTKKVYVHGQLGEGQPWSITCQ